MVWEAVSKDEILRDSDICMCICFVAQSCPTLCNPMDYSLPGSSVHGDSPGKNAQVGCHALLQGSFPTQGLNPGLLHCRQILYSLSHQGSPVNEWKKILGRSNKIIFMKSLSSLKLKNTLQGLPGGPVVKTLGSQRRGGDGGLVAKSNAGGPGSVLGQETRSHVLWLRVHMPQLKDLVCCNKDLVCHT